MWNGFYIFRKQCFTNERFYRLPAFQNQWGTVRIYDFFRAKTFMRYDREGNRVLQERTLMGKTVNYRIFLPWIYTGTDTLALFKQLAWLCKGILEGHSSENDRRPEMKRKSAVLASLRAWFVRRICREKSLLKERNVVASTSLLPLWRGRIVTDISKYFNKYREILFAKVDAFSNFVFPCISYDVVLPKILLTDAPEGVSLRTCKYPTRALHQSDKLTVNVYKRLAVSFLPTWVWNIHIRVAIGKKI